MCCALSAPQQLVIDVNGAQTITRFDDYDLELDFIEAFAGFCSGKRDETKGGDVCTGEEGIIVQRWICNAVEKSLKL